MAPKRANWALRIEVISTEGERPTRSMYSATEPPTVVGRYVVAPREYVILTRSAPTHTPLAQVSFIWLY